MISVALTVKYLGAERYGLWATISSVLALLAFADLGLGNGLVNVIAEAHGRDDQNAIRKAVSTATFMLAGIAVLLLLAFALVYPHVPWPRFFNVTSDLASRESGSAMAVFFVCFAINLPLGVVQRVQMGFQETGTTALWQSAGYLLSLGGVVLAVYLRAGLPWLVLAMAGAPILATLLNCTVHYYWMRPWLMPQFSGFDSTMGHAIASTGFLFFLIQLFTLLGNATDNVVIAHVLGAPAVATYAITKQLFSVALLAQVFLTPLWPAFGEALARDDMAWARRTLNRALTLGTLLTVALGLPLLLFYRPIIAAWAGSDMVPPLSLAAGFAVWLLLGSYGGVMSTFLNNETGLKRQAIILGTASIASLLLKIAFAYYWQLAGVIWAVLLGYGLFYVLPAARLAYVDILRSPGVRRELPHGEHAERASEFQCEQA